MKQQQIAAVLSVMTSIASPIAVGAASLPPGLYLDASGAKLYIATEHELPDAAYLQYLNATTGATGALSSSRHLTRLCGVQEERGVVHSPLGVLGFSLFYRGTAPRTTVLLIHGADAETREMGWIIPYFACNGVNVISYDQRGTGESSGDWLMNGPPQRARDADAIYDGLRNDPHVDSRRIGVWGFSNGGWTAPIVALDRALAFMILQSAPAATVEQNAIYEARETMRGAGHNATEIGRAVETWQIVLDAIEGRAPISVAKMAYAKAERTSWFGDSLLPLIPEKTAFSEPQLDGWRRFISYDPAETLIRVRTSTLALYGARDTKVDLKHDVPMLEAAFRRAGMRDLTVSWFPDAGHTMKVSSNGFDDAQPARYSRGYPSVMLVWLRARGFAPSMHESATVPRLWLFLWRFPGYAVEGPSSSARSKSARSCTGFPCETITRSNGNSSIARNAGKVRSRFLGVVQTRSSPERPCIPSAKTIVRCSGSHSGVSQRPRPS